MTRHVSRKNQMSVLGLRGAALLAAVVAGTGCAESIGDIDRTQPDLIAKKHFEGQWYLRETVVDVPETSPTAFVGLGSEMEMLVWEIQQDYLVGYRAYEVVPGIDHNAASDLARPSVQPIVAEGGEGRNKELYKGAPVAAYHIEAHVDVQRGYNSRTGEQNNIISENTSDRPWQDRAFMRVDWSNNAVDNLMSLSPLFQSFATMSSFVPQNEGGADAFNVHVDDDTGLADYMDFTLRYTAAPSVMSCVAAQNQRLGDCTGEEIKIRTSMLKVDPAREQEYVPLVYDDRRQGEFGFFRVERPTYDRRLGNTFTGLIQVAGRHDLWEHSRDASGVPLEFSARTLKPMTYTLSENFPDELRDVAKEIAAEYDGTFKTVISNARKQTVAQLEADIESDTGGSCLFCLDLNLENKARNGDLRRNFVYWVDQRQAAGPLGFGPSYPNPETGRTVSASAYVYGSSVDYYAESAKQIVELMIPENQGGLTEEELINANYFREAIRGDLNPIDPRATARIQGLSGDALTKELLGNAGFERLADLARAGKDALPTAVPGLDQARLARLVGTDIEAKMIPSEWARDQAQGKPSYLRTRSTLLKKRAQERGETPPVEGPQGYLSLTNWFGPDAFKEVQELEDIASKNNITLAHFDDPAIGGLAREMIASGLQGDDLFQVLRKRVFRAVMLHELGHTVGLRHNFAGSADALNYKDEYWPERIKTIDPVARYTQGTATVAPAPDAFLRSNCSVQGPLVSQANGPITSTDVTALCDQQVSAQMAEKQYSTIMDYGARFNSDFHGLGHYDLAAIAAGYGDLVEVFDTEAMQGIAAGSQATGVPVRDAMMLANTIRNPILAQGLDNAMAQMTIEGQRLSHYTNYPALMGGYQNIAKRRFMPRTEYLDTLNQAQNLTAAQRASLPVKVPYLSCYDEFVDSVETCHRYDLGADNYEIVSNSLTGYREYYVFNNFYRDRIGFDPFQVAVRTAQRYFLPLTNMYQHWLWNRAITGLTPGGTPRGDLGLLATFQGLFRLMNTMSTPEYGAHQYDTTVGEYVPVDGQCPEAVGDVLVPSSTDATVGGNLPLGGPLMSMPMCVEVPRGVGRSFFSRYDSSGYDVFRRILESGHYYDQLAAMAALQASNASVVGIGQDVNADARVFRIPYNLAFPEELEGIFSDIFREDDTNYGLHIERVQGGTAQVVSRDVFTDPAATAQLPVIAPGRSYTTRVQALVAGMNLLDSSLNTKFAKQGQVSLVGSGESRTAPAGFTSVEVADPVSGRVFQAFRSADRSGGPWYAADLVEQAQKLVADPNADEGDIASVFGDLELVRMAFNVLGQ
ncbi:MAG: hypothetical protein RL033_6117 [Pseudomonadota bacterium]|jgi:hypothetical protein